MKKIIAILLCTFMLFSVTTTAFAATDPVCTELSRIGVTSNIIMPRVYTACTGGNGICQMLSTGFGFIYDIDNHRYIVNSGACWQCKNCLTVLVTEGDPLCNEAIGKYVFWPCNYNVSLNGTIIDVTADMVSYTSSTRLEGIHFEYR